MVTNRLHTGYRVTGIHTGYRVTSQLVSHTNLTDTQPPKHTHTHNTDNGIQRLYTHTVAHKHTGTQ